MPPLQRKHEWLSHLQAALETPTRDQSPGEPRPGTTAHFRAEWHGRHALWCCRLLRALSLQGPNSARRFSCVASAPSPSLQKLDKSYAAQSTAAYMNAENLKPRKKTRKSSKKEPGQALKQLKGGTHLFAPKLLLR